MLSLVESLFKKILYKIYCLNAVISTNESTQIITGHVIYNPAYTYKFQLKTTQVSNFLIKNLCLSSFGWLLDTKRVD